jgi:hypothetical protein
MLLSEVVDARTKGVVGLRGGGLAMLLPEVLSKGVELDRVPTCVVRPAYE